MHKYLSKSAILFFVLFSTVMYAQSNTQTVCTGGVSLKMEKTYTVSGGASGSTYNWTVTSQTPGVLDPVFSPPLPTTASITIDWKPISSGVYKVKVTGGGSPFPCLSIDPSSCSGSSSSGEVTVTIKNDKNPITSVEITMVGAGNTQPKVCSGNGSVDIEAAVNPPENPLSPIPIYTYKWVVPPIFYNVTPTPPLPTTNKFTLQNTSQFPSGNSSEYKVTVTDILTRCEYFKSENLVVNTPPNVVKIQRVCGDTDSNRKFEAVATAYGTASIGKTEWSYDPHNGNDPIISLPLGSSGFLELSDCPSCGGGRTDGKYKVIVTDSNGCSNSLTMRSLHNISKREVPTIEIERDNLSTPVGGKVIDTCATVTLKAIITNVANLNLDNGNNVIKYQWKRNGNIAGMPTTANCTVSNIINPAGDVYTVTAMAPTDTNSIDGCSSDPDLEAKLSPPSVFTKGSKNNFTSSVLVKIGVGNAPDFKFDTTSTPPGSKVEEISPAPLAPPEYTASFCAGSGGVTLKAIPFGVTTNLVGLEYEWKSGIPPNTTALVPAKSGTITAADGSYNAMAVGDYTLTIKVGSTGCPKSKTVRVTENKVPVVTVEYKTGPCIGVNLEAKTTDAAASSYQYQWYRQIGSGVMLPEPGETGTTYIDNKRLSTTAANEIRTYAVDVTYGLCTKRFFPDPNNGYIFNPPIDVLIESTTGRSTSCKSEGIILKATVNPPCGTGGCSYEWKKNGSTSEVLKISTSDSTYKAELSGTYTVAVTKAPDTCPYTSPGFTVTLNPNPTVVINDLAGAAVTSLEICEMSTTPPTLVAETPPAVSVSTYQWKKNGSNVAANGNSKNYTIQDTTTDGGRYTVTVTDSNNCTSEASSPVKVTVNSQPNFTIVTVPVNTYEFCADPGASVLLKAIDAYLSSPPGSFSFEWRKDSNPTPVSTVGSYNATDTGTYTLKVTDTGHPLTNCSSTSTPITVTKKPLPVTEEIKHD